MVNKYSSLGLCLLLASLTACGEQEKSHEKTQEKTYETAQPETSENYRLQGIENVRAAVLNSQTFDISAASEQEIDNLPVRVIVAYNENAVFNKGSLERAAFDVPASVSELKVANKAVETKLRANALEKFKPIEGLPLATVELTLGELENLSNTQAFASVFVDEKVAPELTESNAKMGVTQTHNLNARGAGTTIAILDTGVQVNHPFFGGRVIEGACYSSSFDTTVSVCPGGSASSTTLASGGDCGSATRGCDHGTHVAGIAAGRSNSSNGLIGVAPDANIMAVQVFSRETSTPVCQRYFGSTASAPCSLSYTSDQIRGLARVAARADALNIVAANMSLGGGYHQSSCDINSIGYIDGRKPVIDRLKTDHDVVTIIATANAGYRDAIGAPACISSAIAVGSVDDNDNIAGYSNISANVDLLAIGSSVDSSVINSAYGNKSGTSMAAPQVAGAVAALKSAGSGKTTTQIIAALKSTGVQVRDRRSSATLQTSIPRIDVIAAYRNLYGTSPQPAVTPTPTLTLEERVRLLEERMDNMETNP